MPLSSFGNFDVSNVGWGSTHVHDHYLCGKSLAVPAVEPRCYKLSNDSSHALEIRKRHNLAVPVPSERGQMSSKDISTKWSILHFAGVNEIHDQMRHRVSSTKSSSALWLCHNGTSYYQDWQHVFLRTKDKYHPIHFSHAAAPWERSPFAKCPPSQ